MGTGRALFAQLRNGQVVAWGNGECNGDISGIRRESEQGIERIGETLIFSLGISCDFFQAIVHNMFLTLVRVFPPLRHFFRVPFMPYGLKV